MTKIIDPSPFKMDSILLMIRIGIAALMLNHGIPKLLMLFSGAPVEFPAVLGMSPELSLTLAVFSEVLCSLLILFGLGTRLAVIPLIVTMLVAVFYVHWNDPFAKQELGLLFLLVYATLLQTGSGRYSLDNVLLARVNKN
ncbi:MAG TPA: DoxX family protein [Cyclobacteriaceae bacterium]|nr:DoxX family protein [Cyclobacteriaceae bacterium]